MMMFSASPLLLIVFLLAISGHGGVGAIETNIVEDDEEKLLLFQSWANSHGKDYSSKQENQYRFEIWKKNHDLIQAHNHQDPPPTFTMGHNRYSDWTQDEFEEYYNLGKYSNPIEQAEYEIEAETAVARSLLVDEEEENSTTASLPDYVNWVTAGAVTNVKNQGQCGSCWDFSATGAIEGAAYLKTGVLTNLSEQQILDCDRTDWDCGGGYIERAFIYDHKAGGLCSDADYPYTQAKGPCKASTCTAVPGTKVKSFVPVFPRGNEMALLSALARQPVSVNIESDTHLFMFYQQGVITSENCGEKLNLDHSVLAVGYGTDLYTQEPYFLVKNSWGVDWGEKGYVRIGRQSQIKFGVCAILKSPTYPIVE